MTVRIDSLFLSNDSKGEDENKRIISTTKLFICMHVTDN